MTREHLQIQLVSFCSGLNLGHFWLSVNDAVLPVLTQSSPDRIL